MPSCAEDYITRSQLLKFSDGPLSFLLYDFVQLTAQSLLNRIYLRYTSNGNWCLSWARTLLNEIISINS